MMHGIYFFGPAGMRRVLAPIMAEVQHLCVPKNPILADKGELLRECDPSVPTGRTCTYYKGITSICLRDATNGSNFCKRHLWWWRERLLRLINPQRAEFWDDWEPTSL